MDRQTKFNKKSDSGKLALGQSIRRTPFRGTTSVSAHHRFVLRIDSVSILHLPWSKHCPYQGPFRESMIDHQMATGRAELRECSAPRVLRTPKSRGSNSLLIHWTCSICGSPSRWLRTSRRLWGSHKRGATTPIRIGRHNAILHRVVTSMNPWSR